MKIINEDIQNLERFVGNKKVDVHAELPLIMADTYNNSKEAQEEIDKEMKDHNEETKVELNKVLGAEDQPVPELPVEPKSILDESLFEDFKDECLTEDTKLTTSIKNYIDQGHIDKNKFINAVLSWYEKDPLFKSMLIANGFYTEEDIEDLNEAKKSDEDWDLFGTVEQELVWENPNFKNRTKFPNIPATQRYQSEDIGVEYNKDGFIDLTIRKDNEEDFDFARKVAKEYNLTTIGPNPDGPNQFKFIFRFPEE